MITNSYELSPSWQKPTIRWLATQRNWQICAARYTVKNQMKRHFQPCFDGMASRQKVSERMANRGIVTHCHLVSYQSWSLDTPAPQWIKKSPSRPCLPKRSRCSNRKEGV